MRLLVLILLLPIASCSTYMENKIGQEFKSIQPDFSNFENITSISDSKEDRDKGFSYSSTQKRNSRSILWREKRF